MVSKCAKGLFGRLRPAVLQKKMEMFKFSKDSVSQGSFHAGWASEWSNSRDNRGAAQDLFLPGARIPEKNSCKLLAAHECWICLTFTYVCI